MERGASADPGRPAWVRLDRIEPCPFQARLVFPAAEVEALADSIRAVGLLHPPHVRPHPGREGWVQLMPGEMRVRALRLLAGRGEGGRVLRQGPAGAWLAPVILRREADEGAEAAVFAENEARSGLSAWEVALAWKARRDRRGGRIGVRELAAACGGRHQTVAPYLAAADALTGELLAAAGAATAGGEPDHARLARLPLASLVRVTRAAQDGPTGGAERLLRELARAGDADARALLDGRARALGGDAPAGFQVNIRQPLASVSPRQAAAYLARMAPAVRALCTRAAAAGAPRPEALQDVADALEAAASLLRPARSPAASVEGP